MAFLSQERTKEIGIRKTRGESNSQVVALLPGIFGRLLLVACLIGIPMTYYLSAQWLSGFAYQTELSVWLFGGAVFSMALITVLTVGFETLKASMTNPVMALKHESPRRPEPEGPGVPLHSGGCYFTAFFPQTRKHVCENGVAEQELSAVMKLKCYRFAG